MNTRTPRAGLSAVAGALLVCAFPPIAQGADLLLLGRALTIKNKFPDQPNRNRVAWVVKDPAVVAGAQGGADDPRCVAAGGSGAGGSIRIVSDGSGGSTQDTGTMPLPCANWSAISGGYRYRDREQDQGPCRTIVLKNGHSVRAVCTGRNPGSPLNYDLIPGVGEGAVGTALTVGTTGYCTSFFGYNGIDGSDGRTFRGRNAPPPGACPSVSVTTTSTTTPSTTTTTLPIDPVCAADPSRTIFAGLPQSAACQQFNGDPVGCESAYHFGQCGFASCFYDPFSQQCQGCGFNNESNGACINTCQEGPEPTCPGDPSRDIFAGFAGSGACGYLSYSPTLCERAFHITGNGISASCYYDPIDEQCYGCGPNNESQGNCVNTCPSCEGDATRTTYVGHGDDFECADLDGNQAGCEQAFQTTDNLVSVSCFYDTDSDECRGCDGNNQENGLCLNTCALCRGDASRTVFIGGPGSNACDLLSGNPVLCEQAFHLGGCGNYTTCFFDFDTESCRGCGPTNQLDGKCVDTCPAPPSPSGAFLAEDVSLVD
jgi:hypothetical protein